jgi:hypothetical protein
MTGYLTSGSYSSLWATGPKAALHSNEDVLETVQVERVDYRRTFNYSVCRDCLLTLDLLHDKAKSTNTDYVPLFYSSRACDAPVHKAKG